MAKFSSGLYNADVLDLDNGVCFGNEEADSLIAKTIKK
jgi:hypothetical protein